MGGKKRGNKKELAGPSSSDETVLFVQPGQTLADRYHLVKAIARGAMGIVFLAEDRQLENMEVAVKVLPAELATNARAQKRLQKEAMAAMSLNHPNIVNVRDYQLVDNVAFLVMELLTGPTLDDELAEEETLEPEKVKEIAKEVAQALNFAHEHKVIHRDIKPSNLMYHQDGERKIVKLTDFGIAYEVKDTITRLTGLESGGTLNYVAPEQLEGELPCEQSDQYSLAATLYELLSGRPPFVGAGLSHQILNALPKAIDGVPQEMNVALLKALSKKPAERFSSVDAFLKAFCQDKSQESLASAGEMGVVDNSTPLKTEGLTERETSSHEDSMKVASFFAALAMIVFVLVFTLSPTFRVNGGRISKQTKVDLSQRVNKDGHNEPVAVVLKKARCTFRSKPAGAKVYCVELDKQMIGKTDGNGFVYEFEPGQYNFSFVKSGYHKRHVTQRFNAGAIDEIVAYLQSSSPPPSPTLQTAMLPSPKPPPPTPRIEVMELGRVRASDGAKSLPFTLPSRFKKVVVSTTFGDKTRFNAFGGWNAWMKVNGERAWKFVGFDSKRGSRILCHRQRSNVFSNDYEGKWYDITDLVRRGRNELSYYHYTEGDGFYVFVKIFL